MYKMIFIIESTKDHGYRVMEFYKDGTTRIRVINKRDTKLRLRKPWKYELVDDTSGLVLTDAIAIPMLQKWGHKVS